LATAAIVRCGHGPLRPPLPEDFGESVRSGR
jgi:hypothetical protein